MAKIPFIFIKTICQSPIHGRIIGAHCENNFMFEKILKQIKEPALAIIQTQSNIPSDKQETATDDAISSISTELDRILDSGDFSSLSGIKNVANPADHPTIQNIMQSFSQKLQSNCQLDANTADNASASVIPHLFTTIKEKFSSGGVDPKSLMSNLSLSDMMKLMANMGKLKEALGK